jgi:phenol hydroxylase P5 protein
MTYELTIEPLGETIEVEEDQTLLDAALRAGIWLPHACCHGLCATCKVQVVEGEVEIGEEASPFALMDFEREEGMALACCSTALSDVVIEADVDEDPDAVIRPVEDYQGTVTRLVDLTPTAKGVFIELDGEGLEFQAGQYVNLELPDIELPRAFSMANSPAETNVLELNIRRVPGGAATSYVHDQLQEGDRVRLAAGPACPASSRCCLICWTTNHRRANRSNWYTAHGTAVNSTTMISCASSRTGMKDSPMSLLFPR